MRDWIASAMKNYKGSDMDITTARPMLNSPTKNDDVGQRWLAKVLSRLYAFQAIFKKSFNN
jgi:hypothetical protein